MQIEYPRGGILSKEIIRTKKNNLTLFCMAKGSEMSEHTSTKEGFVYVIEGKGKFALKGETIAMLPGTLIHMEKNIKHSLSVEKNTSFLLSLSSE